MKDQMKYLALLLVAYIMAAPLTTRISLDLRLTHWWDVMTYVIWLCSGLIWVLLIGVGMAAVAIVASRK